MRTILFIHGFAADPVIWKPQIKEFSRDHNVSIDPENTQSRIIIGWSLGGFKAIDLCLKRNNSIKALVLVSSFAKFLKCDDYPHGLPAVLLWNLERKLKANIASGLRFFYSLMFNGKEPHPIIKNLPVPDNKRVFEEINMLKIEDKRELLPKIKVPVLIIHGEKDQISPIAAARYLNENISGSELVILPEAGHAPFLEEAEIFNSIVRKFIKKHEIL
jgi:pimeloyl-[acyl-carrier protein] methyl ester esterase